MERGQHTQKKNMFKLTKKKSVSAGFLSYDSDEVAMLVGLYRDYVPFMVVEYAIDDAPYRERIEFELFWDDLPRTSLNFAMLLIGFEVAGKMLQYEGSYIHRVVRGFVAQGGDFTKFNGRGGLSIYGKYFNDESFLHRHSTGSISMANIGPNTNSSQFFIALRDLPCLDEVHVVFGRVRSAADMNVLRRIESIEVDRKCHPIGGIKIVSGGLFLPHTCSTIP